MKEKKKSIALFTDCLCFESFFSAGLLKAIGSDWYFTSESKIFFPFRKILSNLLSISFKRLDYTSYSNTLFGKSTLYETIQQETKATIRELLASDIYSEEIKDFSDDYRLNREKANHFLTVHYFPYVYRFIEIKNMLIHLESKNSKIILLNSPITAFTSNIENLNIGNYRMIFSNFFGIKNREHYFYDYTHVMKPYFRSRRIFYLKEILKTISLITYSVSFRGSKGNKKEQNCLGIEMLQRKINPKGTNDLFFVDNEQLQDSDCCIIEESIYTSHYKKDSYDVINSRDFSRLKFFNYKALIGQRREGQINKEYQTYFLLKIINFSSFFKKILCFSLYLLYLSPNRRLNSFLLEKYEFDSYIWSEIYKKFNISVVWTMLDGGYQQVSKSQAIERNDGVYCGSHWSNYPMILVFNYKPYDIMFSWSEHFENLFLSEFSHSEFHHIGYTSSDYFEYHKATAAKLRDEYPGKLIITFNDNIFHNDIAISESHYDDFYSLAIRAIEENEDIVVFIKPKRVSLFHEKIESFKKLQVYLDSGKARLFSPENERSKITPAELAMASDLVIGLGTSTTTLESFISGTPAINLDLCKFPNNEFCVKGMNKVVFDDSSKIIDLINEYQTTTKESMHKRQEEYYKILDPFLDRKSGYRAAKKLKNILNRKSNLDTLQS